jgi:hypothetical protein
MHLAALLLLLSVIDKLVCISLQRPIAAGGVGVELLPGIWKNSEIIGDHYAEEKMFDTISRLGSASPSTTCPLAMYDCPGCEVEIAYVSSAMGLFRGDHLARLGS